MCVCVCARAGAGLVLLLRDTGGVHGVVPFAGGVLPQDQIPQALQRPQSEGCHPLFQSKPWYDFFRLSFQ